VESWTTMQAWLLQLRRRGVAVLLVHHASRAGNPRGSIAREDTLDVVIELRRPSDYDITQGARFEAHLTKARGIFGADARPFEAKLETRDGEDVWSCTDIRDLEFEKLRDLQRQGLTVRQIAEETGLSKSTVARKLQEGANP
jgi:putative DNA primase/helicase